MKILLGKVKTKAGTCCDSENMYLEKHNWDCGWYWGFGYIGNKNCHSHFKSLLYNLNGVQWPLASDLFETTKFTDSDWWIVRDLFVQAYALKKAAEIYRYGGHQTTKSELTNCIESKEKASVLNADLKIVLDKLWDFMNEVVNK